MRTALIAFIIMLGTLMGTSPSQAGPFERNQRQYARVRAAFDMHLATVQREFKDAGAAWPPRGMFLRAFKLEGALELWAESAVSPSAAAAGKPAASRSAADKARVLVRTFPICEASGVLGPKSRSGDYQVPEGFYTIDRFNPRSSYHLSLGIDYPNAVDKARAAGEPPGGDIFIHGDCVTVGCLPLQDGPIEALYVVAVRARDNGQKQIPVHLFPCRFGAKACAAATANADPVTQAFWKVLEAGYRDFETNKIPPSYTVKSTGYVKK